MISVLAVAVLHASASLESAFDAAAKSGFQGIVVAGDADGQTFARSSSAPEMTGQVWRWASVSKQVTAVLAMRQVERGALGLDTTVNSVLPEFRGETGGQVTVRQLMQHVSGLPNPDDTPALGGPVPSFYTRRDGVSDMSAALGYCSGAPKRPPSVQFDYNNCDTLVLSAILERITGKPFAALLDSEIVKPLGLTSVRLAGASPVTGYDEFGKPEPEFNLATYGAGGAITGTPQDLFSFDRALMAGRLLKPESLKVLWSGDPKLGYVALGAWSFPASLKGCTAEVQLVERRGAIGGIQVRNIMAPALNRAAIMFTNSAKTDFGEIWQGQGLSYDFASAAFCNLLR